MLICPRGHHEPLFSHNSRQTFDSCRHSTRMATKSSKNNCKLRTRIQSASKNRHLCQYSLNYYPNNHHHHNHRHNAANLFILISVFLILTGFNPVTNSSVDANFDFQAISINDHPTIDVSFNLSPTLPIPEALQDSASQYAEPHLVMNPKNVTAIDKTTAILICEVRNDNSGRPPKYEWFKDNAPLKNKKRTPHMKYKTWSVLRLEPLKIDRDEGIYACSVDLESGATLRSEISVKIIQQADIKDGFPVITKHPAAQQSVELGGLVTIDCRAQANPEPEYAWLHNTFPIEYDNGRITTSSDGSTLKINNVTDSDKGEYLCIVTNSKGYVLSAGSSLTVSLEVASDNPPTDLKYKLTSATDVTITWQHPVTKNSVTIISYEIYFGKLGSSNSTKQDIGPDSNRVAFNDLSENTEYTFRVRPRFTSGFGSYSKAISFVTPKDSPPPPPNVKAVGTSYTTAMLWWDDQSYFDGINGYRIYYNLSSSLPTMNIDYDKWMIKEVSLTSSVSITNLLKDETYEARVGLIGPNLSGKLSSPIKFRSAPMEVPYDLKVTEVTTHSAKLTWKPPLELQPNKYKISYEIIDKSYIDAQGLLRHVNLNPVVVNTTNAFIDITDLSPFSKYRINVTAVPFREYYRPPLSVQITTHMAAPKQMIQPTLLGKANNPREFEVFLPRASEEFGIISHYFVIVLPISTSQSSPGQPDQQISLDPDSYATTDLKSSSLIQSDTKPYITAKFSKSKMVQKFTLGDNKTYEGYKNRELNPNMDYYVFVRAVVDANEALFTSSPLSDLISFQAKMDMNSENLERSDASETTRKFRFLILFAALGMVLMAGLIATLFYKNQRQVLKTNQINETTIRLLPEREIDRIYSAVPAEPQQLLERRNLTYQSRAMLNHPNVPVSELAEHIEVLKLNNNLKDEYESIEPGQQFTWEHSYLDCNRSKNRYGNVVAYDHSRVMLSPILDPTSKQPITGSDYINANYCDGYNSPNQYIATQGPLPNTVGDFWRMVWEQKSRTIVMMTQLEERGRVKCVQYWPSKDSVTYFGITITGCICSKQCVCVEELAYYTIRTFKLQFGNTIREVRQFQFTAWPDHGVPDHPTPFLMFLRRIKITNPLDAGPMVVLCSAGVGRTGCYIVIDSMIERIKHDNTIDIYGHVTRLRAQRNYIVQTEDQYMFIHDAVLEAIISADTVVPVPLLTDHLQKLLQISAPTTTANEAATGLELEFKRLSSIRNTDQKFTSANLPVNKHKNRLMNILPYESTRVCLEPIAGVEGSDYINGSFCDGYTQRNAYIATQSPLPETVDDLWRMVVEHNSGIIVMLTKLKEMGREKCTQFWPAQRYGDYGPYRVSLNQEYDTNNYMLREFTITDSRNPNYSRVVRTFHYMDWPEQGVPKSGDEFINFITDVHNTKSNYGIDGPITVLCSVGVGRTGVFIALSITLERLRNEGFLNLFETVRTLRTQRPGMVQTEDQYQFCYQTALEYIRKF